MMQLDHRRYICLLLASWMLHSCKRAPIDILGTLNENPLTASEFRSYLQDRPEIKSLVGTPQGRKQAFDLFVKDKLLESMALKAGIRERPNPPRSVANPAPYRKWDAYRFGLEYLMSPKEGFIRQYYGDRFQYYMQPLQTGYLIMTPTLEAATQVRSALLGRADPEVVARKYSVYTQSGDNTAKLPPFRKGDKDAEFEKRFFDLDINGVADPYKTPFGFAVLMRTQPLPIPNYKSIANEIRLKLARAAVDKKLAELQSTAKVTVDEKQLYDMPL